MVTRAERKRYNKQVKEEAVKNIQEQRKSMDEIALELNIPKWPLENWICGAWKNQVGHTGTPSAATGDGEI